MPQVEIHPLGWLLIGAFIFICAIGLSAWCLCVAGKDDGYHWFKP
jgi:hypothetical protein